MTNHGDTALAHHNLHTAPSSQVPDGFAEFVIFSEQANCRELKLQNRLKEPAAHGHTASMPGHIFFHRVLVEDERSSSAFCSPTASIVQQVCHSKPDHLRNAAQRADVFVPDACIVLAMVCAHCTPHGWPNICSLQRYSSAAQSCH